MMNGKKTEPEEPLSRESEPLYRQAAEILRDPVSYTHLTLPTIA